MVVGGVEERHSKQQRTSIASRAEPQAPESGRPAGGVPAQAPAASGVRVLRAHGAARTGTASAGLLAAAQPAAHLPDAAGGRLLPSAGLPASRHQAGEHSADRTGSGETVRLRVRADAEPERDVHGLRGDALVSGAGAAGGRYAVWHAGGCVGDWVLVCGAAARHGTVAGPE